jgi:hypothetical protein
VTRTSSVVLVLSKALTTEERDADHAKLGGLAVPDKPRIEVDDARSIRESRHYTALNGNCMTPNFCEKGLAQGNCILKLATWYGVGIPFAVVPEDKLMEKMKPRPVQEDALSPAFVCAEKTWLRRCS